MAWQHIKHLLSDPDTMADLIEDFMQEQPAETNALVDELEEVRGKIERKRLARQRAMRRYAEDEDPDAEALVDELRGELEELRGRERTLVVQLDGIPEPDELLGLARAVRGYEFWMQADNEPFEVRQAWIDSPRQNECSSLPNRNNPCKI